MFLRALVLLSLCCWGALAVNWIPPGRPSLRLVRRDGRCRGELQLLRQRKFWIGADSQSRVPWWFGHNACAELGCGPALSVAFKTVSKRDGVSITTYCDYSSPAGCLSPYDFQYDKIVELNCSDSVRLVSGQSSCSGSLQIRDQSRSWTSVCDGALDRRGAEVLCRELGCGAPLLQGALSPLGQMFHCEGHESALMHCPRNQTRTDPGTCPGPTQQLTCSEPLRLVGGASRCRGTLEASVKGEWRRVKSFGGWDLTSAPAVCRDLGCGSAVSAQQKEGLNKSAVWEVEYECVKKKTPVKDCIWKGVPEDDHGLEVVCTDSVRLVSGRSLCSGSLQIRDQSSDWTSVCEGALDRRGAEVLCRELGCGAPLLQGELSPLGQTFHCEGHESALMDCPRNQTRTDPGTCPTQQVTCSDPVRLVGGSGRCGGTLEVRFGGEWRRVRSHEHLNMEAAGAVCQGLGCGSAVSAEWIYLNEAALWNVDPVCAEKKGTVRDCVWESSHLRDAVELLCLDSVRLVSGRSLCSGSVQIRDQSSDRSWTTLCEGALDRRGAEVLCRELSCGAPLLQGALSPLGQTFHCKGNESSLMDCPRNQTRTDPGTCSGPLHITCSEPVRLVGGPGRCAGILEMKHRGEWRRAMNYEAWDLDAAGAVCRGLDCGSALSVEQRKDYKNALVWHISTDCVKRRGAVRDCSSGGTTREKYGMKVVCSDSVRLVPGKSLCSGSLQIRDQSSDRSWTPLCEGALDRRGAEVLCRELGCGAPLLQGALSPLGQTFHCEGHESALMDCPRNQTRTDPGTCSALQLTCSEPLRLVGGASRCEGTVELRYRGVWKRVVPNFAPFVRHAAPAVCEDLGCGSVVSMDHSLSPNKSAVWDYRRDCDRGRSAVRDCVFSGAYGRDFRLEVVCSGHQGPPEGTRTSP